MLFGRQPACGLRVSVSDVFWSSGQKVSPPSGRLRRATFSALSGMSAFLVLLQAADSQRSQFGSNSADHRLLPLCNRKIHRLLPNCHPVPHAFFLFFFFMVNISRRGVRFKYVSGGNTVDGCPAMKAIGGSCRTDRCRT